MGAVVATRLEDRAPLVVRNSGERAGEIVLLALPLIFLIAGECEFYLARKGSKNLTACENRNLCSREHDHPPVCRDAAKRSP